jgi:hypothetical protein
MRLHFPAPALCDIAYDNPAIGGFFANAQKLSVFVRAVSRAIRLDDDTHSGFTQDVFNKLMRYARIKPKAHHMRTNGGVYTQFSTDGLGNN